MKKSKFTEIKTRQGKQYLCIVLDLVDHRVVGMVHASSAGSTDGCSCRADGRTTAPR
jgi:hypothetical protein